MTTCVHLDKRCPSWEACATRTAKDSGRRAEDLLCYAREVTRLQGALAEIAGMADAADDDEAPATLDNIMSLARRTLGTTAINIVGLPHHIDPLQHKGEGPSKG